MSYASDTNTERPRGYDPQNSLHSATGNTRRQIIRRVFCHLIEGIHTDAADRLRFEHPVADQLQLAYRLCDDRLDGWVPDRRWTGDGENVDELGHDVRRARARRLSRAVGRRADP